MSTEAEKDKGIDEIMKMNIPPEDKVHYIADLAKHRGKCMDEDAIRIHQLETTVQAAEETIKILVGYKVRYNSSMLGGLATWLNNWAKS
jgi:hypothetical protein